MEDDNCMLKRVGKCRVPEAMDSAAEAIKDQHATATKSVSFVVPMLMYNMGT